MYIKVYCSFFLVKQATIAGLLKHAKSGGVLHSKYNQFVNNTLALVSLNLSFLLFID